MRSRLLYPCLAMAAALALAACGGKKDTYVDTPVDKLYNQAMDSVARENWQKAAQQFEVVDRQHPASGGATKAQLMAAYALYQDNKYDQSIVAADRFIQLHPGNRDVAYAYYLKALDYYVQIAAVLGYNYPGSKWYSRSYALMNGKSSTTADNTEKGWFGSVVGSIF